ncbi:MAG: hypothetical protein AB1679_18730 [Actinomycetota bacterium]
MQPTEPQTQDPLPPEPDTRPTAEDVSRAAASRLVAACEAAWRALQAEHPEIPDAVIVLGTGMERGRLVKLGHWWGGQWVVDQGQQAEVLLAGEALHLSPEAVFEVLAHEAAHGINAARGIKDTSRGGRYHNASFKEAAEKLGLTVSRMKPHGWAETTLGADARERYAEAIAGIATEMRLARHVARVTSRNGAEPDADQNAAGSSGDANGGRRGRGSGRPVTAICGCGRRMRMAPSVLAAAPVLCAGCGGQFADTRAPQVGSEQTAEDPRVAGRTPTAERTPEWARRETAETTPPAAAVVDNSFLERRRQALEADAQRSTPYAESLRHLEDFEAALVELCRREHDPEARRTLEVFRDCRADILDWLAEFATADVVPFPGESSASRPNPEADHHRETDMDLRTIDLPLADPGQADPPGTVRRREPPTPELGA